ncbi:MAG: dihydroorotate dehydrogenase [Deltaproteobacteria bacterium]|nr:dihydroorotate dehydrogenase [Deltaproteobacteria bacterium]
MPHPTLVTDLCGVRLENPLVLASGILGVTASSLLRVANSGAGAVTTKSFSVDERPGHKGPTILSFGAGLINAVGLSNPGVDAAVAEIRAYKAISRTPIVASIFGRTVDEFGAVAERAAAAHPDLIEVNVSCPNVAAELGTPFEADPATLAAVTRKVKAAARSVPVSVKLSTNFGFLARAAQAAADAGADLLTAINTVGPGIVIDTNVRRPVLANVTGGVSGRAILPIAVRAVFEISRAVRIPIIGTGGVASAEDALQMLMAGATAVGIGSAVYDHGVEVFAAVGRGLTAYLEREGLDRLDSIRGAAHVA